MGVPTGTYQTFQSIGNREDLEDIIYNISPLEFPFTQKAARGKAKAVYHEWQTDSLAAAAANRQIEGDDATILTAVPTVRVGNYCQISSKAISIAGTQDAIDKAGRDRELSYQLAKRSKELRRDMEYALVTNQASSVGGAGTARSLASVESWLATNKTSNGTGTAQTTPGFASGTVAAPTDSTVTGAFTVTSLKAVIASCWTNGGNPEIVMVGAGNKQVASGFAGIATLYRDANGNKQGSILGAADVYVSDFGEHKIIANRYQRNRTALVLDMDYWEVAYLRPFQQFELAKTGDSEKRQLLVEYTLVAKQEAASGKVTDLS